MFKIDIGAERPTPKSAAVEDSQRIVFTTFARADRAKRQVIENLWTCETTEDLTDYLDGESLLVDALHLFDPAMAHEVAEAEAECRACLTASTHPSRAEPGTTSTVTTATKVKPMFNIDPGASGDFDNGPFYSFKPKGSVQHGLPLLAWYMREKLDTGWALTHNKAIEETGVVLDIFATHDGQLGGTLKLGWSKSDGTKGVAPERRWWASPLRSEPRPDESKNQNGGYNWVNSFSVKCAMGGGKAATLEADGWGAYRGFADLLTALNPGFASNIGKCPLVKVTGYEAGKNTTHPVFALVQWVDRPDCIKPETPAIAAAPAPAAPPAPQPAPAAPAAPAAAVPADVAF